MESSVYIECLNGLEASNTSSLGVMEHSPIEQGQTVLIYLPSLTTSLGVITTILPKYKSGGGGKPGPKSKEIYSTDSVADGPCAADSVYYSQLAGRVNNVMESHSLPFDLLPGEWGRQSMYGSGILISQFMSYLKASERAKLEFNVIDDFTRLTTHNFQHLKANGLVNIVPDAGYITEEYHSTDKACKLLGLETAEEIEIEHEEQEADYNGVKVETKGPAIYDTSVYKGALARTEQLFQIKEDKTVLHESRLPDGSYGVRGRHQLSMVRSDMIPNPPARTRAVEDPEGDQAKEVDEAMGKELPPFKYTDAQHNRNVQDLDSRIYELKELMGRFDELKKDFETKDELNKKDIEIDLGNGYKLHDDGSVHIWDKAGSEIFLNGDGDISIAPKRDLLFQAGRNIVGLAPADVVFRAKDNVDITADKEYVKLFAGKSIEMLADKEQILLEARKDKIVIKAEKDLLLSSISGKVLAVGSEFIAAVTSKITMTAAKIYSMATDTYYALSGSSGLVLTKSSAQLAGRSIGVVGGGGNIQLGDQSPMMQDSGASQYPSIGASLSAATAAAAGSARSIVGMADAIKFLFHPKTDITTLNETLYQMFDREVLEAATKSWDMTADIETTDKTAAWPCNVKINEYTMKHNKITDRADKELKSVAGTTESKEAIYKY